MLLVPTQYVPLAIGHEKLLVAGLLNLWSVEEISGQEDRWRKDIQDSRALGADKSSRCHDEGGRNERLHVGL